MAFLCPIRFGRSRSNKKERLESVATPMIGRITGSASIDTLVRVGLEKERVSASSKAVVVQDFVPQVDDELGVERGEIVYVLYKENDWIFVMTEDQTREGFIPRSYCEALGTALADMIIRKKKRDRTSDDHHQSSLESSIAHSDAESVGTFSCRTEVHPFFKDPAGRYLVLYTFVARDENDLSVERGELVTVLNREDPDWFWVLRSDGQEGFVPSAFVYPADMIESHAQSPEASEAHSSTTRQEATSQMPASMKNKQELLESQKEYRYDTKSGTISQNTYHNGSVISSRNAMRVEVNNNEVAFMNNHHTSNKSSTSNGSGSKSQQSTLKIEASKSNQNSLRSDGSSRKNATEDQAGPYRAKGSELVMLYDYESHVQDELDVKRGEWVYADLNRQKGDWLWVYSPRLNKYGFVPKSFASSPAMTSL